MESKGCGWNERDDGCRRIPYDPGPLSARMDSIVRISRSVDNLSTLAAGRDRTVRRHIGL